MTWIDKGLIHYVKIVSKNPNDPVEVTNVPNEWQLIGRGNYAAVFIHPSIPDKVVKVYAENRKGLAEEVQAYQILGKHPSYSELFEFGERYLVLKKLNGITLYEALRKGMFIPKSVIKDVDQAIKYAKSKGLNPADIHGKNVMMKGGRGYILDISDFLMSYDCPRWRDFKRAFYVFYYPIFSRSSFSIPVWLLERVRKGYQVYIKARGLRQKQG
ncbi:serine/threonine protein kinase [Metabacillus arenae]|uniref:serine/threonine protein kinase n=1 Tax=Metabacillus arenae TaxID=2771434 RepID=UPI001CD0C6D9|nr:serine/threonine protein kinase [Metabacillus arenae]